MLNTSLSGRVAAKYPHMSVNLADQCRALLTDRGVRAAVQWITARMLRTALIAVLLCLR